MLEATQVRLVSESGGTEGSERRFLVTFDAIDATWVDAINADAEPWGLVPRSGSLYAGQIIGPKTARRMENNPLMWEVIVPARPPSPADEAAPEDLEPEGEAWGIDLAISTRGEEIEQQMHPEEPGYYLAGKPIVNSAGDPVTGVMTSRHDCQIEVSYTTNLVPFISIESCMNKINAAAVTMTIRGVKRTFDALTLRFDGYDLSYTLDRNGSYYPRITLRLTYRPETWLAKIADRGVNRTPEGATKVPIVGQDGQPISEPVPLDGNGEPLGEGMVMAIIPPGKLNGVPLKGTLLHRICDMQTLLFNYVVLP